MEEARRVHGPTPSSKLVSRIWWSGPATVSAAPVGETFTLGVVVRNACDGAADARTLRYYRSTDSTISASDEEIGTDEVGSLGVGESSEQSIEVTVEDDGTYSYGACVDAGAGESDTANNCSPAATGGSTIRAEFEGIETDRLFVCGPAG